MTVQVAHLSLAKTGESKNGDRPVFRAGDDAALFAVIDGLGHGPEAARVAAAAAECLDSVSLDLPLIDILHCVHRALSGTRGAAGTFCLMRNGTVQACTVGNVELRCSGIRLAHVWSAGVLGARVRKFHVCSAPVAIPARFLLFSDGVTSRVGMDELRHLSPADACARVMHKYRRPHDDATVLVADVG